MEDKNNQPKKCFCARCFCPIEPADRVDINEQSFHKNCCTCCVCNRIPKSLKMFYGHVFCEECFKNHVLSRLRGDMPKIYMNNWWMQFKPDAAKVEEPEPEKTVEENADEKPEKDTNDSTNPTEPPKKCFCARCLQAIENNDKVHVNGQCFHRQCCKCCCCNCIPTIPKIYFGHVFCENCFYRFVLSRNKGDPSEFFMNCLEEWQKNNNFSDNLKKFMAPSGNKLGPMVFMTGQHPCFSRCGANAMFGPNEPHELRQTEPKKSATLGGIVNDCRKKFSRSMSLSIPEQDTNTEARSVTCPRTKSKKTSTHKRAHVSKQNSNEVKFQTEAQTVQMSERSTDILDHLTTTDFSKTIEQFEDHWDREESAKKLSVPAAEKIENLTKYLHKIDIVKNTLNFTKKLQNVEEPIVSKTSEENLQVWNNLRNSDTNENDFGDCVKESESPKASACPICLWQYGAIYVNV